jgi:O-acetyl-ADP-ribose deacetylase (regulator of RNase III)|tara:strand:- start:1445 stop:2026 length:582 start_codon:yes stop_codon:yes gene_type:complete
MKFNEIQGNLITLAQEGMFDVIAHGCNCFCVQGAGLAPQMVKAFATDKFPKECLVDCDERFNTYFKGDINKLGQIDFGVLHKENLGKSVSGLSYAAFNGREYADYEDDFFFVVNAYTQYGTDVKEDGTAAVDYAALELCMRKINHVFKGKHIGLPLIGCGLAGGNWEMVKKIIKTELVDCDVTIVHFTDEYLK